MDIKYDFSDVIPGSINNWLNKNRVYLFAFVVSFLCLVIIYGQKIFFSSYATDDYARIMHTEEWYAMAYGLGRWSASLFNAYIFKGSFHVLPYVNSLMSLLFVTASGVVVAKFLNINSKLYAVLFVLLFSVSSFYAHNLSFNINTTVSIGLFLSALSAYFIVRKDNFLWFLISVFLMAVSLGIYQTSFQSVAILLLGVLFIRLILSYDVKSMKEVVIFSLKCFLFLCSSYYLCTLVNALFINVSGLNAVGRYGSATSFEINNVLRNVFSFTYLPPFSFLNINHLYFKETKDALLLTLMLAFSLSSIGLIIKNKCAVFFKLISLVVVIWLFGLIVNMPLLIGIGIPYRAYYPVDSLVCILFVVTQLSSSIIIKRFGLIVSLCTIAVNILYISVYYDGFSRQTKSDIALANSVFTQIQIHERVSGVKINDLYIVGVSRINVYGYNWEQQAYATSWSKYKIFENFTNLKFNVIGNEKKVEVDKYLSENEDISAYPDSTGLVFYKDVAVLVLDPKSIP